MTTINHHGHSAMRSVDGAMRERRGELSVLKGGSLDRADHSYEGGEGQIKKEDCWKNSSSSLRDWLITQC